MSWQVEDFDEYLRQSLSIILGQPPTSIDEDTVNAVLGCSSVEEVLNLLTAFADSSVVSDGTLSDFARVFIQKRGLQPSPIERAVSPTSKNGKGRERVSSSVAEAAPWESETFENTDLFKNLKISPPRRTTKGPIKKALRSECLCHGSVHGVVANCLTCGRVTCKQEGPGRCYYCGSHVDVSSKLPDGEKLLYTKLIQHPDYDRAQAMADRLLQADMESERVKRVVDLETDFYEEQNNPWLTEQERETARKNEDAQKFMDQKGHLDLKYAIDFKSRTTHRIDVQEEFNAEMQKEFEEFMSAVSKSGKEETGSLSAMTLKRPDIPDDMRLLVRDVDEVTRGNLRMKQIEFERDKEVTIKAEEKKLMGIELENLTMRTRDDMTGLSSRLYDTVKGVSKDVSIVGRKGPQAASVRATVSDWRREDSEASDFGDEDDFGIQLAKKLRDSGDTAQLSGPDTVFGEMEYSDSSDQGVTLSLHQPWASLMVYGFKRIEGRVWSTDYRGRLWIHAASKTAEPEMIKALEMEYTKCVYKTCHPPLPTEYPTSCLLGCVDLIDCISQDDLQELRYEPSTVNKYYQKYKQPIFSPDEGNSSPFVFICKAPRKLVLPISLTGQHKLWLMPASLLTSIQKCAHPVVWPKNAIRSPTAEDSRNVLSNPMLKVVPASLPPFIDFFKEIEQLQNTPKSSAGIINDVCLFHDGLSHWARWWLILYAERCKRTPMRLFQKSPQNWLELFLDSQDLNEVNLGRCFSTLHGLLKDTKLGQQTSKLGSGSFHVALPDQKPVLNFPFPHFEGRHRAVIQLLGSARICLVQNAKSIAPELFPGDVIFIPSDVQMPKILSLEMNSEEISFESEIQKSEQLKLETNETVAFLIVCFQLTDSGE